MKTTKLTRLGRLTPSLFLLPIIGCVNIPIIDSVTEINLHTRCGDFKVKAKVDTGADGSSIDETFAKLICVDELYIGDTKNTKCENGQSWVQGECRNRVVLRFTTDEGIYVEGRATLSNKTDDRYPLLVGNREIEGRVVVRPIYETTTENWSLDQYEAEEEEEN